MSSLQSPSYFFVLPENSNLPSGGNLYNHYFIEALKAESLVINLLDWEAYLQNKKNQIPGFYFIDTLFMDALLELGTELKTNPKNQQTFLIVHHLESLFPPEEISSDQLFLEKEKATLDSFDGFLCTSTFTKQYLLDRNYLENQIFVIPPALWFRPKKEKKEVRKVQALIVANLVKRKGIFELIQEISRLNSFDQNFEIRILGTDKIEPTYAQDCKNILAEKFELKNKIDLFGEVKPSEMANQYAWANLFISAAKMETFGMAIQEALASGLPVLCLEGGYSAQHIRPSETGFIYQTIPDLVLGFHALCQDKYLHQELCVNVFQIDYLSYNWKQAAKLFNQAMSKFYG